MTRISWTNNVLIPSINHTKAIQKNNANKMNAKKTHEDVKEREREKALERISKQAAKWMCAVFNYQNCMILCRLKHMSSSTWMTSCAPLCVDSFPFNTMRKPRCLSHTSRWALNCHSSVFGVCVCVCVLCTYKPHRNNMNRTEHNTRNIWCHFFCML